jgi:hypothetical protein
VFSADPASPTGYVSKCCVTQNQVCMKPGCSGCWWWHEYEAGVGALHAAHCHRQVHTCGMEVCELTAVALTVAPLPPPRSLRRAQASTSPRLA